MTSLKTCSPTALLKPGKYRMERGNETDETGKRGGSNIAALTEALFAMSEQES